MSERVFVPKVVSLANIAIS